MSDHHDEIARLLAALGEPEPPNALRERALGRAQGVWPRPTADRWIALWTSRPLRIAWAGAVAALVVANVAVRVARRAPTPSAASQGAGDSRQLQAITALPRLRPEYANAFGAGPAASAPAATTARRGSEDKS